VRHTPPACRASAGASTARTIGGCSFTAYNQDAVTGPDTNAGYLAVRAITLRDGGPVPARITCDLLVNGAGMDNLSATGPGVEVGTKTTVFVATATDVVTLCTTVDYGGGVTDGSCGPAYPQIPPPCCDDPFELVDAVVCPVLETLAGTYGPVTVAPDGDVRSPPDALALNPIYDCPPYSLSHWSGIRILTGRVPGRGYSGLACRCCVGALDSPTRR
jgi:hypothetical protein